MNRSTFFFGLILTVFLTSFSVASDFGRLTGTVIDKNSGERLPDANLLLKETKFGIATDNRGEFTLEHLAPGGYVLQVSHIGYSTKDIEIDIRAGEMTTVTIELEAISVRFREVLVTATRDRTLSSEITVAHEVLDHSRIELRNSQNVGEVLQTASSIFIKNYGHIGALKTASIRGASESQVLVLLDGQRINMAQGVAPDLSDIPLQAIQRIEVIRGGHSALYGTDAVGGVVNLITRSPHGGGAVSGNVSSTVGSFGTRIVESGFGQQLGKFGYYITHNYTTSDGDFEFENADGETVERTNNDLNWNDTFVKLGYDIAPSAKLRGYVQFHDAERGAPGPLSFPSETATQKDQSWKFNLRYQQQLSPNLDFQIQTYLLKFKQNFDDPGAFEPIASEHQNDAYGFDLQSNWSFSTANQLTAGYEFREDKINSTDVSEQKRTIHSLFLQDRFRFALFSREKTWVSVIPAIRLDKYSDVETQLSPKIGMRLSHFADVEFSLRGNVGRSYRVPSFNDLYWPSGPFTAGNPNLAPEKGIGYDVGMGFKFEALGFWGFETNYFNTELENLIIWGPRADGVWSPANVQDANLEGVEVIASFQDASDFVTLRANYNYLNAVDDTRDTDTRGNQLIYRPEHEAHLSLAFNFEPVQIFGIYRYVGRRFADAANEAPLDGFSTADLGASLKVPVLTGNTRFRFELRNLLDEHYQVIDGFPTPGREFRTSLSFTF